MQHYQGSVAGAILDTYGFIGLDAQKLISLTSSMHPRFVVFIYMYSLLFVVLICFILMFLLEVPKEERARRFFDDYAAKNNFDPLVPENWYKVSHTDLINAKVLFVLLSLFFFSSCYEYQLMYLYSYERRES